MARKINLWTRGLLVLLVLAIAVIGYCCSEKEGAPTKAVKIIAETAHDESAYCQGLFIHDGVLWESAGKRGESRIRKIDLATGKLEKEIPLDASLFAEGMAIFDGLIYQLTWKSGVCFVWDAKTLIRKDKIKYDGEGWGLTANDKELIMSSGSNELVFREPVTFKEKRRVTVTDGDHEVAALNELEWIEGEVWANVYQTSKIAIINPETGKIRLWLDCAPLKAKMTHETADVLNGIAYDAKTKKVYVTGKYWTKTFEIQIEN